MDKATQTMIDNLHRNTGKTLEEWIAIVRKENKAKHGEVISFLKDTHGLTHGFANLIAHKAKGSDADSAENKDDLVEKQYKGKEHFKPVYDTLMSEILKFGSDIEIAPKNSYVSFRRKKQFVILQPATKTRFEIGLNMKGQEPKGKLETITTPNAMCSHRINVSSLSDIDKEILDWLKSAYDKAV